MDFTLHEYLNLLNLFSFLIFGLSSSRELRSACSFIFARRRKTLNICSRIKPYKANLQKVNMNFLSLLIYVLMSLIPLPCACILLIFSRPTARNLVVICSIFILYSFSFGLLLFATLFLVTELLSILLYPRDSIGQYFGYRPC